MQFLEGTEWAGWTTRFVLFTGADSARNIRMYQKAGYRLRGDEDGVPGAVRLTKARR